MKNKSASYLSTGGIIAALYVILSLLSGLFGLSSGPVQLRLSEMLCILPFFSPSAVPGLFIGCLISNVILGAPVPDVIFGSLATLIGAIGTLYLKKNLILSLSSPVIANTLIVPFILKYVYELSNAYYLLLISVFVGEFFSAGLFGYLLYSTIQKHPQFKQRLE